MAFNNLGLQEPSTITARVATVTIQRGSTVEHQEILVIGDATSSNAVAQVTNAAPSTSAYGLAVRQVDAVQSAQSGAWTVRANLSSTSADNPVTAAQSGTWTVRANLSSTSADNPVTAAQAGTWNIGTVTAVSGKVSVVNSSAADLNVTVAGYSTTVNVSSLAGIVAVRPSDTNWASSAGFHFNSSGELLTVAAVATSTTVNVSSLAGRVAFAGYHASGSIVNVTDSTNNAINVNVVAGSAAGSTVATISRFQDSSNNGIAVADSVNNALRVNVVAGSAGGSTIVTVSTGSVRVHQSTAADLQATVAQASTVWAVQVGGYSTTVNVSSLAGKVTVINSSAADFLATVSQAGTWNIGTVTTVSSLAGIVAVRPSDTNWASSAGFHFNSSGELLIRDALSTTVSVSNFSTTVNVSSLAGRVTVAPSDTNWASSAGFHFDSSGALQISGTINASASTVTTVSAFYDSSNVAVQPGDATNKAIRVNVVAGTIVGGSGGTAQADQSAFTTNSGSITPIGGYFSTTASVVPEAKVGVLRMSSVRALWTLPVDSTGGDMTDSTNRALRMNVVAGGSTTVNVSSVGGVVTIAPVAGSTWTVHIGSEHQSTAVQPANSSALNVRVVGGVSSAADFQVTARVEDNLGNDIESSTSAVGTNSTRRGLAVRSMLPLSTYVSAQAASSGDVTVFTSVAGQSIYVYGVCLHWGGVMTTNTNQLVRLQDGNSSATEYMRWRFQVSAIGATTQPLQAFVSPPAYLFRTAAGTNLRINTASSGLSYSLQCWYE